MTRARAMSETDSGELLWAAGLVLENAARSARRPAAMTATCRFALDTLLELVGVGVGIVHQAGLVTDLAVQGQQQVGDLLVGAQIGRRCRRVGRCESSRSCALTPVDRSWVRSASP